MNKTAIIIEALRVASRTINIYHQNNICHNGLNIKESLDIIAKNLNDGSIDINKATRQVRACLNLVHEQCHKPFFCKEVLQHLLNLLMKASNGNTNENELSQILDTMQTILKETFGKYLNNISKNDN